MKFSAPATYWRLTSHHYGDLSCITKGFKQYFTAWTAEACSSRFASLGTLHMVATVSECPAAAQDVAAKTSVDRDRKKKFFDGLPQTATTHTDRRITTSCITQHRGFQFCTELIPGLYRSLRSVITNCMKNFMAWTNQEFSCLEINWFRFPSHSSTFISSPLKDYLNLMQKLPPTLDFSCVKVSTCHFHIHQQLFPTLTVNAQVVLLVTVDNHLKWRSNATSVKAWKQIYTKFSGQPSAVLISMQPIHRIDALDHVFSQLLGKVLLTRWCFTLSKDRCQLKNEVHVKTILRDTVTFCCEL